MGVILIDDKPFHYTEVEITYENAVLIDKLKAKELLFDFKKVLDQHGLAFLLMHGTLLGAVREHDFIAHDIDIDVCVTEEQALRKLIPILAENDINLCRYEDGIIYSFIREKAYIDVYIAHKAHPCLSLFGYCRYCGQIFPQKYIYKTRKLNFLGRDFCVPALTMQLLRFWYGKTWNIPIKDKPSKDLLWFIPVYRKIIKFILGK